MSKITIGDAGGRALKLDLDLLIPSRLLIQANSGGGKSWLLRRLAEQFFPRIQTIVIDPEGEFYTLREKFGYVLVGEGGETPADVRSAELLAERFLELKASAICDLYEAFRSKPMQRRQWVSTFINALLDAPRTLWHPLVVIVDEAHKFCPQESPKAASMIDRQIIGDCKDAMIALGTTGRKRGFCPIWATQRLAKLDKDASAEFFNRLVGMTIEDVDVDRAADLMSVSKDQKQEFRQSLRTIAPGDFYAFGRAISLERVLVKVGPVETHHPESGKQAAGSAAPPMPDQVKKFLPQLSDLPKEAEQKVRTVAELEQKVRELTRELNKKPSPAAAAADPELRRKLELSQRAEKQLQHAANRLAELLKRFRNYTPKPDPELERLQQTAERILNEHGFKTPLSAFWTREAEITGIEAPARANGAAEAKGERAILLAIAQAQPADREQLTVLSGYKRSTRNRYIQFLQSKGLVEERGEKLFATEAGIAALGADYKPLPTGEELQRYWLERLPSGEQKIFEFVLRNYTGTPIDREAITEASGFQRSTRNRYIQFLQARHLLKPGAGAVEPAEMLFDGERKAYA